MCDIKVSIICNAYNHEKYIRDALDGFIMQKTNFKYEILVHDDASTDHTADIIREYEKKYPGLIKPIYQTENQYSKGNGAVSKIQRNRVCGKYTAICEGDDYWTDPLKLQKQFDLMEQHPEVDMCAHAADVINANTKRKISSIEPSDRDTILTFEQVLLGGGAFISTNSLFYRSIIDKNMPKFRQFYMYDYSMQIHGAMRGGILYIHDNMSAYRQYVGNSWTDRMESNSDKYIEFKHKEIRMINLINEDTEYRYSEAVRQAKLKSEFYILKLQKNISKMKKEPYKSLYKQMSFVSKSGIYVDKYMPSIYIILKNIRSGKYFKKRSEIK